jgi:hypothetical protein
MSLNLSTAFALRHHPACPGDLEIPRMNRGMTNVLGGYGVIAQPRRISSLPGERGRWALAQPGQFEGRRGDQTPEFNGENQT